MLTCEGHLVEYTIHFIISNLARPQKWTRVIAMYVTIIAIM